MKRMISVALAFVLILSAVLAAGPISAYAAQADESASVGNDKIYHDELTEGVNSVSCSGDSMHCFPFHPDGAGTWKFSFANNQPGDFQGAAVVYKGITHGDAYAMDTPIKCEDGGSFEVQLILNDNVAHAQFDIVVTKVEEAYPQITSLTPDENGITIRWAPMEGAAAYRVYYAPATGGWKRFPSDVKGTSLIDTGVEFGRKETYTIRALDSDGNLISDYNKEGWSVVYSVDTPQITSTISDENGINIKWDPVEGASIYRVYYKNSEGNWKRFPEDVKGTSLLDTGVLYDRAETYTIRALNKRGDFMSGYEEDGWTTIYMVDTPQITSTISDGNGINIKWDPVEGASTYRVYYLTSEGNWKRFPEDVKGTSLLDTGVLYERAETYTIRALNKRGDFMSGYKEDGWTTVYMVDTPQITSTVSDENGINIKWDPVEGASTYRVYYLTSEGNWKRFPEDVKGTSLLDTGILYERAETYTIRALNKRGGFMSGYKEDGWTTVYKVDTPQIKSTVSDENGINIKWDPVEGASTYRVYYMTAEGNWKRFPEDVKGTSLLDTGVVYDRAETYTIRALNKRGDFMSGYEEDGWTTVYKVDTPQITSTISDENGINIKWDPVEGASTYRVYYMTAEGTWKRFPKDVTGTSLLDTGVIYGRAETYTIRALNKRGDFMSGYDPEGWTTSYEVETPEITNLENTEDGIRITWDAVPGVSTYRVYYKTTAGEWRRFGSDTKGTSRMDTGVAVGRAETYTVRALDTDGNPISGYNDEGWSIVYNP